MTKRNAYFARFCRKQHLRRWFQFLNLTASNFEMYCSSVGIKEGKATCDYFETAKFRNRKAVFRKWITSHQRLARRNSYVACEKICCNKKCHLIWKELLFKIHQVINLNQRAWKKDEITIWKKSENKNPSSKSKFREENRKIFARQ